MNRPIWRTPLRDNLSDRLEAFCRQLRIVYVRYHRTEKDVKEVLASSKISTALKTKDIFFYLAEKRLK
jgi:hypothetical protein